MFLTRFTVFAEIVTGLKLRLLLLPNPSPIRFHPVPAALQIYNCCPPLVAPVLMNNSFSAEQAPGSAEPARTGMVAVAALASTVPVNDFVPAID